MACNRHRLIKLHTMISLNLLPTTKKEELKFRKIYLMAQKILFILLLFTFFLSITILSANLILASAFKDTAFSSSLVNASGKSSRYNLIETNEMVKNIKEIQDNFINYDDLMVKITEIIPKDITLNRLSIDTAANKVSMSGYAKTRSDLIALQNNFKNFEFFDNLESPISNLLEKRDIIFNINVDLKI